jgi:hypothetical protein
VEGRSAQLGAPAGCGIHRRWWPSQPYVLSEVSVPVGLVLVLVDLGSIEVVVAGLREAQAALEVFTAIGAVRIAVFPVELGLTGLAIVLS